MMIRSAPAAQISRRGLAILALGTIGLGAVTFGLATYADESQAVGNVLHRAQSQSDALHFEQLLDTLGVKHISATSIPAAMPLPEVKRVPTNAPIRLRPTQSA